MDLRDAGELRPQFLDARRHAGARLAEQPTIRRADAVDGRIGHAAARHLDLVVPADARGRTLDDQVGRHILRHPREASHQRAGADGDEVMEGGVATDRGAIADMDMPSEEHGIGHGDVVAELAVMRHMGAHHEQVAVAKPRGPTTRGGTAMDGHLLADVVAVADLAPRLLAAVLAVLRGAADRRERVEHVVGAEAGVALDHHMVPQDRARADGDLRPDHAPWADDGIVRDLRGGVDDGGGVDLGHGGGGAGLAGGCGCGGFSRCRGRPS